MIKQFDFLYAYAKQALILLLLIGLFTACETEDQQVLLLKIPSSQSQPIHPIQLEQKQNPVVYGNDDRLEYFELPEGVIKQKARTASIALMRSDRLNMQNPSNILLNQTTSLGRANQLCDDQPFVEQPKAAFCSGTLVAPDLILTAGHCLDDEPCESLKIVFRYLYLGQNQLAPITEDQVYQCAEILHFQNDIQADYGWIRLTRPVLAPFTPAELALDMRELSVGQPLNMMGSPNGIPMKIDQNGRITFLDQSQRSGFFNLSVDAFGGNSGSGIYDQLGRVRGILVRGRTDYLFNEQRQCNEVATATIDANGKPLDGLAGEVATHVSFAMRGLCDRFPNEPLCLNQVFPPIDPNPDPNALLCQPDAFEPDDLFDMPGMGLALGEFHVLNHCDDGEDFLSLLSEPGGSYDIETYPLEADTDTLVSIYSSAYPMDAIASDDDGGYGYGSLIEDLMLNPNEPYVINIHSYQGQFGANRLYALMAREHCQSDIYEHDDFPSPQIPALNGSFLQRYSLCDEDWIPIQLEAGIRYRIETLNLENTDTLLELYQVSGVRVMQNDDREPGNRSSYFEFTPQQGQKYWLKVSSAIQYYGGNQIYEVKVSSDEKCDQQDNDLDGIVDEAIGFCLACLSDEAEPDQSISQAYPLQAGKIYRRNHCYDSQDYAMLSIEDLSQSFDIEVYPYDPLVDTMVDVLDAQEQLLNRDDNGRGAGPGSLIFNQSFEQAGQYYLKVYEKNGAFGEGHEYGVLLREHCEDDPLEHDDWRAEAKLREGDNWREQRSLCDEDWITVQLRAGITYLIQTDELVQVDTYLEVYQGDQIDPLVSDDDSGPGYGSRVLIFARNDVSLKIRVKTYSNFYGGINQYHLSLMPVPDESCDGVDNNFNGEIDEGLLNACGKCGEVPMEICDDIDNDCDQSIDEGVLNACGKCGALPIEICDGVDNDCDQSTDEGTVNLCGRCGPVPSERCDGMDNDCDEKIDEGCFGYDAQGLDMSMIEDAHIQLADQAYVQDQVISDQLMKDYRLIEQREQDQWITQPKSSTGHLDGCQQSHLRKGLSLSFFELIQSLGGLLLLTGLIHRFKSTRSSFLSKKQASFLVTLLLQPLLWIDDAQAQVNLCVDCHPEEVKGYLKTGMGKALYRPDASKMIESFDRSKATVIHPVSKAIYQAVIDEQGKWWQIEKAPQGDYERRVEVKYIIGSGNHTRSYIGEIDGGLVELPLTWYVQKGIWDMSPGYEEKNHFRFNRPIKADCIFCHNDLSKIKEFSLSTYQNFQEGIGCDRCHGNSSLHIKKEYGQALTIEDIKSFLEQTKIKLTQYQNPLTAELEEVAIFGSLIKQDAKHGGVTETALQASALGKALILNPKNLDQERQNEICDQCHLTGNARILYPNQSWDRYDPNLPLHEYMGIYIPDRQAVHAQNDAKFGISSHGERLKQSECFQKSSKPMLTCSTCHHPHQETSQQDYQNACLSCHQSNDCEQGHQAHQQGSQKACFDCHMYKGETSDIPHVNFTDHWIRKNPTNTPTIPLTYAPLKNALKLPSQLSASLKNAMEGLASVENARFVSRSPLDWQDGYQKLSMALEAIKAGQLTYDGRYELSLARAEKALGRYEEAGKHYWDYLKQHPNDPIASLEGADVLSKIGQSDKSIQIYETILALEPSYHQAMMDYANLLQGLQKLDQADTLYRKAMVLAPDQPDILFNYGYLALQQKQYQLAKERFEQGIQRDGLKGEGYFHLGILSIQENQVTLALESFKKALDIDPEIKEVYWMRGRLLMFARQWKEAENDFKRLLTLDPAYVSGYLDFSHLYVLQKRYQDAKAILEQGIKHSDASDLIEAINFVDVMIKHDQAPAIK